ncbi:hypothetical protein AB0J86_20885 [Micromonospora sp. NPDC049559]|uniref:hypothetical protein n=1 Tax=Micromonospora sp. NPDC049559 TaxID=3155923 RepID=UPI00341F7A97
MTADKLMRGIGFAGLAVLGLCVLVTPFALVVGASWGLVVFCRRYVRRVEAREGLRYNLCATGVLYLIPIGIAATFYCLLAVYLRLLGDSSSVGWLGSLQRSFEAVSAFFSENLSLTQFGVLAVLAGVYLLTLLLLRRRASQRVAGEQTGRGWRYRAASALNGGADLYTRYSGPLAAGLATLAAFSFFGMQLGVPSADLRLRLKIAQEGYAEVTKRVEADLSQRVAGGLYAKVYAGFPGIYRQALNEQATAADVLDDAGKAASYAKTGHNVSVPSVDQAVLAETARRTRVEALDGELRSSPTGRTGTPAGVTPEQVAAARYAMDARPEGEGIDLVADGRKKVALQLEKLASERILALTKPLTDAVPMLEPLLQAFADAVDKTVQDRMARAYDRLVATALRDPQGFDAAVRQEAQAIVDQTDVSKPVERAAPRAQLLAETRIRTLTELRNAPALIDQKVTAKLLAEARARQRLPLGPRPLEVRPLELPRLYEFPRLPSYPYRYPVMPDPYGYRPPVPEYRPPPRPVVPPRPVRPPRPPIFIW